MSGVAAHSARWLPLVVVAAVAWPVDVRAQSACGVRAKAAAAAPAHGWTQPLARTIALDIPETSLRDALDRIAAHARLRLSYSAELLPLDRSVCISYMASPIGDILTELLRGSPVEPVVAGADHIVLAPVRARAAVEPKAHTRPPVVPLDPVYVEARASTGAHTPLPVVVEVIDGRQLAERSTGSLAQALNGTVPGIWVWEQASSGLVANYGSIRGASSFGASTPKVYIDGIEVANPLLLTRISPDAIERIEVIRGPQGAALYGADAISGVTNIITRHPRVDGSTHGASIRSGFGLTASDFASGATVAQEHTLGLLTGSSIRSGALNLSFGSVGEFMPGGGARHWSADGSVRMVGSHSLLTGTLRFLDQSTGTPRSPLLTDVGPNVSSRSIASDPANAFSDRLSLRQYTAGVNATFFSSSTWTHAIVAGVDGFSLGGLSDSGLPFASPSDSALLAAGTSAIRGTLRLSSVASLAKTAAASASVTIAAEHSRYRQEGAPPQTQADFITQSHGGTGTLTTFVRPSGSGTAGALQRSSVVPESIGAQKTARSSNTGLSAQINAALLDRVFLVGGVRVERDAGSTFLSRFATLPMLGGSFVGVDGPVNLKFRAAYGKAIRWPELTPNVQIVSWDGGHSRLARLGDAPEEQSGVEGGFDFSVGRTLSIQVTRFDQTASGLVQRVPLPSAQQYGYYGNFRVQEELQNVGEITNRGWEAQASVQRGPLSLGGTLSLVDSRVRRVAAGYTGDLRAGDRMLAVPARTMSLTGAWSTEAWSTSLTAYRAADWINYDRVALARVFLPGEPLPQPIGSQLREYWRTYDGFTHLRATATRALRPGVAFLISADNLLDRQVGEPDNITVIPGRTISLGVRASF